MKRLVLVGGGHAHVEVLRRFGATPAERVELVLISPDRFTAYSGMLPGLVAGHYTFQQCHIDLEPLARFANGRLVYDLAVGLDPAQKVLLCDSGLTVSYDVVSLDIGAAPTRLLQGHREDAGVPVKPTGVFLARWDQLLQGARQRPLDVVVVGGGAGGVEITLAMQHRLSQLSPHTSVQFSIVSMSDALLPGHAARVRAVMARTLAERQIRVRLGSRVERVKDGHVVLQSDEHLQADRVFWATGAQASEWLASAGLATDPAGFVLVAETLQSLSHPDVFAAGDVATMHRHPRPKSGVYAVRQGPPLADNLRRRLAGQPPEPYVPQPRALNLISTGDKHAVASWGALCTQGAWVWRWKDHIDRKFMQRYRV
jgi:selenide, water dikinase